MTNTTISCPACGDRFTVALASLHDDLNRPVGDDRVVWLCGCQAP